MKRRNNDDENTDNIPSIRLKYKGGKKGKSTINYQVVKESSKREFSTGGEVKEEKITIKKESKSTRGIASSPSKQSSQITTKTVIKGDDIGKSGQKITITKTEITQESKTSRAVSGQREAKGQIISKTTEKTSSNDNNRSRSQGRTVKEEVTTKTTTTTTNKGGRVQNSNSGKKEIITTVTNTITENGNSTQRRTRGGKEETTTTTIKTTRTSNQKEEKGGNQSRSAKKEEKEKEKETIKTTTTTNQRQNTRGQSQGQKAQVVKEVTTSTSVNRRNANNEKTVTTTKTVTTAQVDQGKKDKDKAQETKTKTTLSMNTTNQIKIGESNGRTNLRNSKQEKQETTTNQRSLIAQKSTPHLRGNKENEKEIITKTTIKEKEEKKRSYSSLTEVNSNRNNIVRIMIDDTGKIPKKTYVLNVRKLDRIQQNKRQRLLYSSNLEKNNPVHTNFNHNIIIIKNVTRELPTVLDIGEDGKLTHRYNYSSNTNISNIAHKIINESGKIVKKQVVVSPRKNEVIKSFKKPLKLTYENYVETNTSSIQTGINKIPLPKKTEITKTTTNEKESKITETKSSRIRKEGTGNKTTTATTTKTTTTETKMRLGRNKTEEI